MRANTLTVKAAITRYYIQIVVPFFALMFSGFGIGSFLSKDSVPLGVGVMVGCFVLAIVVSLILYSHWIVWAFHNVDRPYLLYQAALRRNLMYPKGSFYNKFNITFTVDKDLYNQAWDKVFEMGDLNDAISGLPINKIVEVKYSSKSYLLNLIITIVMLAFYVYFLVSYDTLPPKGKLIAYIGPIGLIALINETYKLSKSQGKTAFVFRPEHLEFFGQALPWGEIYEFDVFLEGKNDHKVTIGATYTDAASGSKQIFRKTQELAGIDTTPDRIDELYSIYNKLYGPKHDYHTS